MAHLLALVSPLWDCFLISKMRNNNAYVIVFCLQWNENQMWESASGGIWCWFSVSVSWGWISGVTEPRETSRFWLWIRCFPPILCYIWATSRNHVLKSILKSPRESWCAWRFSRPPSLAPRIFWCSLFSLFQASPAAWGVGLRLCDCQVLRWQG